MDRLSNSFQPPPAYYTKCVACEIAEYESASRWRVATFKCPSLFSDFNGTPTLNRGYNLSATYYDHKLLRKVAGFRKLTYSTFTMTIIARVSSKIILLTANVFVIIV